MTDSNMPEDFTPLIEKIEERRPLSFQLIDNLRQQIHWLETHPLMPPPEALVRSMEQHVRDHLIIRRRFDVFVEKIRGVKTADLTAEMREEIGSNYHDILETMKRVSQERGDIDYEFDAWRESLEEFEQMVDSTSDHADDWEDYDEFGEDEEYSGDYDDEDLWD